MSKQNEMYMVYGGVMEDVANRIFKDPDKIEVVGFYRDYDDAFDAWRGAAQKTVDNAEARYFIVAVESIQKESSEPKS